MAFSDNGFVTLTEKTMLYLLTLDKDGNIQYANKRSQNLFQSSSNEPITKPIFDFVIDVDKPELQKTISKCFNKEVIDCQSFRFTSSKGMGVITIKFDLTHHNNSIYASGINITEENKEHDCLQSLSKLTKTGAWYYNPINEDMFFSEECYHLLDLELGTPITMKKAVSYYHPKSKKNAIIQLNKIINEKISVDYTEKIITEKGKEKWLRVLGEPVIHNNKVIFINGSFADITERYEYIKRLKNNEIKKHLALKGIRSGLFDHHFDINATSYSSDFKKMLGISMHEEFVSIYQLRELIHPDDIEPALIRHITALKNSGNHYFNFFRIQNKNKTYLHYEVHGYREKNKEGRTIRMIGNLIDVHQRKLNEQIIYENQNRLSVMVNNGSANTILLDTSGKILMADENTLQIIKEDYNVNAIKTPTLFIDVMAESFKKNYKSSFEKVLQGEIIKEELKRITSKGSPQWLEIKYIPVYNKQNQINSVFISFQDITELKSAEQAIKAAHIKEQELSDLKSNILSNFSHEIRTPLNGIITISNLLLAGEEKPEERKMLLEYLEESKDRLLKTINNLSNFSEIETIRNNLEYKEIDINYAIETCYREFRHIAKSKNLDYELELDESCPTSIIDEDIFHTAINNIINNAIKYTQKGHVSIKINTDKKNKNIYIRVIDSGIGIDSNNLEKIFDPFIQESIGMSREYEGTGIGLSLSKKYIEILGGHIEIHSKLNKGTEFTIVIPQSL